MARKKKDAPKQSAESASRPEDRSKGRFVDIGRAETEEYEAGSDVKADFDEAAQLGSRVREESLDELLDNRSRDRAQSEAAVEAAWEDGDVGGDSIETGSPTPDQNMVDDLGKAVGLVYDDDEPLQTPDKVAARDEHRWELDPASSEGFTERMKHEGEYEEK